MLYSRRVIARLGRSSGLRPFLLNTNGLKSKEPSQTINAMATCPTNGLRCSRYARYPPTGFVEHPGPSRRAEKGNNLTVSANHLVAGEALQYA